MAKRVIVIGAGGHGRSVAEILSGDPQFELMGFVDDAAASNVVFGFPVLGVVSRLAELRHVIDGAIVAIGRNAIREQLQDQLREFHIEAVSVVHRTAFVSPSAIIGPGSVVLSGAQVGVEARLGRGVIVNTAATVDHHCVVEDFGHLGTNACMAGGAILGRSAWMQAGSALGYGVRVPAGEVLAVGEAREHNVAT